MTAVHPVLAATTNPEALLLTEFLKLTGVKEIERAASQMCERASPRAAREVDAVMQIWLKHQTRFIRENLESAFGETARSRFSDFVEQFTEAESKTDRQYFVQLVAGAYAGGNMPRTYAELRDYMYNNHLHDFASQSSHFMGNVQTWVDLHEKGERVPPLQVWLSRDHEAQSAPEPKPKGALASLKEAEAGNLGDENLDFAKAGSPLDEFEKVQKARRKKALERAYAGMEQVAKERKSAEDEYAAKKIQAAKAEAEAIRQFAKRLAAAQDEALKQRENGWGKRLKKIVGATITATSGAFFGGIGSQAAQIAVSAIF